MGMKLCRSCGMLFTDGDSCPSCDSKWVGEAVDCVVCGRTRVESETVNGVCKDCLKKSATIRTAIGLGERYTEICEVNSFFLYHLGQDKINELLLNAIVNAEPNALRKDAERFCTDDLDCLSEYLAEQQDEPDKVPVKKRLYRKGEK